MSNSTLYDCLSFGSPACSGHGRCIPSTGECVCDDWFTGRGDIINRAGFDCQIDLRVYYSLASGCFIPILLCLRLSIIRVREGIHKLWTQPQLLEKYYQEKQRIEFEQQLQLRQPKTNTTKPNHLTLQHQSNPVSPTNFHHLTAVREAEAAEAAEAAETAETAETAVAVKQDRIPPLAAASHSPTPPISHVIGLLPPSSSATSFNSSSSSSGLSPSAQIVGGSMIAFEFQSSPSPSSPDGPSHPPPSRFPFFVPVPLVPMQTSNMTASESEPQAQSFDPTQYDRQPSNGTSSQPATSASAFQPPHLTVSIGPITKPSANLIGDSQSSSLIPIPIPIPIDSSPRSNPHSNPSPNPNLNPNPNPNSNSNPNYSNFKSSSFFTTTSTTSSSPSIQSATVASAVSTSPVIAPVSLSPRSSSVSSSAHSLSPTTSTAPSLLSSGVRRSYFTRVGVLLSNHSFTYACGSVLYCATALGSLILRFCGENLGVDLPITTIAFINAIMLMLLSHQFLYSHLSVIFNVFVKMEMKRKQQEKQKLKLNQPKSISPQSRQRAGAGAGEGGNNPLLLTNTGSNLHPNSTSPSASISPIESNSIEEVIRRQSRNCLAFLIFSVTLGCCGQINYFVLYYFQDPFSSVPTICGRVMYCFFGSAGITQILITIIYQRAFKSMDETMKEGLHTLPQHLQQERLEILDRIKLVIRMAMVATLFATIVVIMGLSWSYLFDRSSYVIFILLSALSFSMQQRLKNMNFTTTRQNQNKNQTTINSQKIPIVSINNRSHPIVKQANKPQPQPQPPLANRRDRLRDRTSSLRMLLSKKKKQSDDTTTPALSEAWQPKLLSSTAKPSEESPVGNEGEVGTTTLILSSPSEDHSFPILSSPPPSVHPTVPSVPSPPRALPTHSSFVSRSRRPLTECDTHSELDHRVNMNAEDMHATFLPGSLQ